MHKHILPMFSSAGLLLKSVHTLTLALRFVSASCKRLYSCKSKVHLQGLTADVNMYNSMWNEEKGQNERLIRDIEEYKTQYFRMRKIQEKYPAENALRNMLEDYEHTGVDVHPRAMFFGGGFKTQDTRPTRNSMAHLTYKTKDRPRSSEILRGKDTNIALVNLDFTKTLAVKDAG